jgi:elongation factor P--(R)-beta-lysine ligase
MSGGRDDWRPSASSATLARRAALLAQARAFFATRGVLEVDTPMVVNAAVTDVHIESARVGLEARADGARHYLHTSPEYAMKRLLAAGSGDIFQICHVVRGGERSRHHNAEFTLIEWYRIGFTLEALMNEVDALVRELLGARAPAPASERVSYRDVFQRELALDPLAADLDALRRAGAALGYTGGDAPCAAGERDALLDLLMAARIGPSLGRDTLTFIHGYPASQAALARLDPTDSRTALRFELYGEGLELANGFHELTSVEEQRRRFEGDLEERRRRGLPLCALDERLLAALAAGVPDCAGVALGFDRVLMLAAGASHIDEVLAFPTERA